MRGSIIDAITRLQRLKTGAIIAFSCEAGAILASAPPKARRALQLYAARSGPRLPDRRRPPGRRGRAAVTGKPVGADPAAGKATFVAMLGVDEARRRAHALIDERAASRLADFEERADLLCAMAQFVVNRRS